MLTFIAIILDKIRAARWQRGRWLGSVGDSKIEARRFYRDGMSAVLMRLPGDRYGCTITIWR